MRRKIIIGNWKMNKTDKEAIALVNSINEIGFDESTESVVCPPLTSISSVGQNLGKLKLGAQNCHFEDSGAFTGEVSVDMLKCLNAEYIIVGHSERREYFGESDKIVSKKFHRILEKNLVPILCVGETLEEREAGIQEEKVKSQLLAVISGVKNCEFIVAYEPIWAIGTGKTASSEDAEKMCGFIRDTIGEAIGLKMSKDTRVIYGGSVNPANIAELMSCENIDGALVGGASLKAEDFVALLGR